MIFKFCKKGINRERKQIQKVHKIQKKEKKM